MEIILSLICSYIACMGFCFIFHIRGKLVFLTPIGGVIIWGVYLALQTAFPSVVLRTLLATMVAAVFCEIIARVMKVPVTVYMIIAILPLVPGSGIYYTMLACIQSNYELFIVKGIETIGIAGAIAAGMLIISTLFRIGTEISKRIKKERV